MAKLNRKAKDIGTKTIRAQNDPDLLDSKIESWRKENPDLILTDITYKFAINHFGTEAYVVFITFYRPA